MTPTRLGTERRDPHERALTEAGQPRTRVDDGRLDQVRRDLDARDELAARDDLAVEGGEHLERVDPVDALEGRDPDVEHAVDGGDEIDPALGRATDRQSRPGDRGREAQARLVLVELVGTRDEHRHRVARFGAGERNEVVGRQAPALLPTCARHGQVTGEDRPDQARGHTPART